MTAAVINLAAAAWVAKRKAALEAASTKEADETIAVLAEVYDGTLPPKVPFTEAAIRALVRSAFNAGALYEIARQETVVAAARGEVQ